MKYKIKEGYVHRDAVAHFDDTPFKDQFQKEVYKAAYKEAFENKYTKVLDIGCGSGYKLVRMFKGFQTLGLEVEPTLSWLKRSYPLHTWMEVNSFWDLVKNKDEEMLTHDILICADVIEHVKDPDLFLKDISLLNFKKMFLSTPERDVVRGVDHNGPPQNETHFREWNTSEFVDFVSEYFNVLSSEVVSQKNGTLMLVVEPKPVSVEEPEEIKKESDNEADSHEKKKGGRPKKK